MRDVFCPRKKDKSGKLFVFVHFTKDDNEETIMEKLNNVWLGSFKLRASIPRYERELKPQTKK